METKNAKMPNLTDESRCKAQRSQASSRGPEVSCWQHLAQNLVLPHLREKMKNLLAIAGVLLREHWGDGERGLMGVMVRPAHCPECSHFKPCCVPLVLHG